MVQSAHVQLLRHRLATRLRQPQPLPDDLIAKPARARAVQRGLDRHLAHASIALLPLAAPQLLQRGCHQDPTCEPHEAVLLLQGRARYCDQVLIGSSCGLGIDRSVDEVALRESWCQRSRLVYKDNAAHLVCEASSRLRRKRMS